MKAYAIAIHIPVLLWLISGFMIARLVFQLEFGLAVLVSVVCSSLIYMIERLVLLSPKSFKVAAIRFCIGVIIAAFGAFTIDLVIFDREVNAQLQENASKKAMEEYDNRLEHQKQDSEIKKADWKEKQERANCEANGKCGSGKRDMGPIYRALQKQAETAESAYRESERMVQGLIANRSSFMANLQNNQHAISQAGLLDRIAALHQRVQENVMAQIVFVLFFLLVFALEMMVLLMKMLFGETIDDRKEMLQARLEDSRLKELERALTSPVAGAKSLVEQTIGR